MNVNETLHKLVTQYINNGYKENKAWLEAYISLVNDGVLTHPYISVMDDDPATDCFYIFAHSTTDNHDYTYISAKYKDAHLPISIGLYDRFYDYLIEGIKQDIDNEELRTDMIDGLSSLFSRICADYVRQLDEATSDRLITNDIPKEERRSYKTAMLRGISDILEDEDVKHLSLVLVEDDDSEVTAGSFFISGLSTDNATVVVGIDPITGVSNITVQHC